MVEVVVVVVVVVAVVVVVVVFSVESGFVAVVEVGFIVVVAAVVVVDSGFFAADSVTVSVAEVGFVVVEAAFAVVVEVDFSAAVDAGSVVVAVVVVTVKVVVPATVSETVALSLSAAVPDSVGVGAPSRRQPVMKQVRKRNAAAAASVFFMETSLPRRHIYNAKCSIPSAVSDFNEKCQKNAKQPIEYLHVFHGILVHFSACFLFFVSCFRIVLDKLSTEVL